MKPKPKQPKPVRAWAVVRKGLIQSIHLSESMAQNRRLNLEEWVLAGVFRPVPKAKARKR